jgi:hypothetical protein
VPRHKVVDCERIADGQEFVLQAISLHEVVDQ